MHAKSVSLAGAALLLLIGCAAFPDVSTHPAARHVATVGAVRRSLLYVSDTATNDVYVYSYPRGRFVRALSGFDDPQGLCTDQNGDVFIANASGHDVLEYAHGGKAPIATLYDPPRTPEGCSVDPTTGNLAVTENNPGSVAIYEKASGKPKYYRDGNQYYHLSQYFFCGYDDHGNLFVDGVNYSSSPTFKFAELPSGGKQLENLTLDQSIGWPGGVQWDGRYLAVGDQSSGVIYQFSIKGKHGSLQGSTKLSGADVVNVFWIEAGKVVGPNNGGVNVMFWSYPAGGAPTKVVSNPRPQPHHPYGATVSVAP